jgi:chromosome segregation ATPase
MNEHGQQYGDLAPVHTSLSFIINQLSEQGQCMRDLSKKHDDQYEIIRKRIHDVVNDYDKALKVAINHMADDVEEVEGRIEEVEKDILIIKKDIDNASEQRAINQKILLDRMDKFSKSLNEHMDEETAGIRKILLWSVALLGSALVTLAGYVWALKIGI